MPASILDEPPEAAWTEADLARVERDGHRYEIVDGSLIVTPPAGDWHQTVEPNVWLLLKTAAPQGWRVQPERGVKAGDNRFEPDVVVFRPGSDITDTYVDASAVALVVEVESRSTRTNDRGNKLVAYAEAGIESYWRVERSADGPVVHVYHLAAGAETYALMASIGPGERRHVDLPYPVVVEPATFLT